MTYSADLVVDDDKIYIVKPNTLSNYRGENNQLAKQRIN